MRLPFAKRGERFSWGMLPSALFLAFAYYVGAKLGFAFTFYPKPISVFWAPNAILLAALVLTPTRSWWLMLLAAFPAHVAVQIQSGVPAAMVIGWFVSNCSEALIGAASVRVLLGRKPRFDLLHDVGTLLVCGTVIAPLLSSFLDAGLVKLIGWGQAGYWEMVKLRLFSNATAFLLIVPPALSCASLITEKPPGPRLVAAVSLMTTMAMLLAIWGAVDGLGPFAAQTPEENARAVQIFVIGVTVPLLLLAVLLEEHRRVERAALEQRQQLTHLSRVVMLGDLAGALAHELNQPLTAILSNAQAAQRLLAKHDSIDLRELGDIVDDIVTADQRASLVIQRLRALFRKGEARFQPLNANGLVAEVLELANGDLKSRDVSVLLQLEPRLPTVLGDPIQLQQVLLNLIINACEAMGTSSAEGRALTVRTHAPPEGGVEISLIDRGPGFPPELRERVFEPFFTTKMEGLGLGLALSRSIVSAHGGRLWGTSEHGRGAAFHVLLPGAGDVGQSSNGPSSN
jgi:signal transduction histidine kinase